MGYGRVEMGGEVRNGWKEERDRRKKKSRNEIFQNAFLRKCEVAGGTTEEDKEPKGTGGKEPRKLPPERLGGESKRCHSHPEDHWGLAVVNWVNRTSKCGMRHSCTTGRAENKLWQWWEKEWVRPVDRALNVPDTSSENTTRWANGRRTGGRKAG